MTYDIVTYSDIVTLLLVTNCLLLLHLYCYVTSYITHSLIHLVLVHVYTNIKKDLISSVAHRDLRSTDQNSNATIIIKGAPSSSHVVAWMNGQAYQEVGY